MAMSVLSLCTVVCLSLLAAVCASPLSGVEFGVEIRHQLLHHGHGQVSLCSPVEVLLLATDPAALSGHSDEELFELGQLHVAAHVEASKKFTEAVFGDVVTANIVGAFVPIPAKAQIKDKVMFPPREVIPMSVYPVEGKRGFRLEFWPDSCASSYQVHVSGLELSASAVEVLAKPLDVFVEDLKKPLGQNNKLKEQITCAPMRSCMEMLTGEDFYLARIVFTDPPAAGSHPTSLEGLTVDKDFRVVPLRAGADADPVHISTQESEPVVFVVKPSSVGNEEKWRKQAHAATFAARIVKLDHTAVATAHVDLDYDARLGGYPVTIDAQFAGEYYIDVILTWLAVSDTPAHDKDSTSEGSVDNINAGVYAFSHTFNQHTVMMTMVAFAGPNARVVITKHAGYMSPDGAHKVCTAEMMAGKGRWVLAHPNTQSSHTPPLQGCVAPACALVDEREESNHLGLERQSCYSSGQAYQYFFESDHYTQEASTTRARCPALVYSPHECTPTFYGSTSVFECLQRKLLDRDRPFWWHVSGDSTNRWFVEAFVNRWAKNKYPLGACDKFEDLNYYAGPGNELRMTFAAASSARVGGPVMNRDFEKHDLPVLQKINWLLDQDDVEGRPDVMILGPAWAYSSWHMTIPSFEAWMEVFASYIARAMATGQDEYPMRVYWKPPTFTYAPAHGGTERITYHRMVKMQEIAERILKKQAPGVIVMNHVVHASSIAFTKSTDGLHSSMPATTMLASLLLNPELGGSGSCGTPTPEEQVKVDAGVAARKAKLSHLSKIQELGRAALKAESNMAGAISGDGPFATFYREEVVVVYSQVNDQWHAWMSFDGCMERLPRSRFASPPRTLANYKLFECYSCDGSWTWGLGHASPCSIYNVKCDYDALRKQALAEGVTECRQPLLQKPYKEGEELDVIGACHVDETGAKPSCVLKWVKPKNAPPSCPDL
jgi:hypothetical protein